MKATAVVVVWLLACLVLSTQAFRNGNYAQQRYQHEPAALWASSARNMAWAHQHYPHDPVQRFVATALGDEMPSMRDDLARQKDAGVGVVARHLHSWTNPANYQFDGDAQSRAIARERYDAMRGGAGDAARPAEPAFYQPPDLGQMFRP